MVGTAVLHNAPAPGVPYFVPLVHPPAGTAVDPQPDGKEIPSLFKPLTIRGVTFPNRIWLSPLCQYSSENGLIGPWQFAHLGGIFTRGPGLTVVEATAVAPEGRISPEDAGIWTDEQAVAWAKIVEFAHSQNQKIAIQLAHAGRKASTLAPFIHMGAPALEHQGGWPDEVVGPSAVPYADGWIVPKELTKEGIKKIVTAFVNAAKRAVKAGFDVIEIHGAHGYLISEFLSPVANKRTDEYGGSFENRIRLAVEVVDAVRGVIPPTTPLLFRVSGTDWLENVLPAEESWRSEDTVKLAAVLAEHGVDLLDVSSSGNSPLQQIKGVPGYQVPFAEAVKKAHGDKILVSTVGSIHEGKFAQSILDEGKADVIFVGRLFQKNPGLVWSFADDLGVDIRQTGQIEWGFRGRGKPADKKQ
ncbi:FMN-linked oxidoreductase [Dichomitus squalens]|uniref:FMN-linked oxidoreductase n=1 Tax=Dichomitus squalens TaxID=114155 RepID=A0A4Q9P9B1_9APHY|nr:FMN-linked oxidoreductase [Dichomitus squalens]TBU51220.1 FMN-linked oxidoreductase [Dichomitus squalens]